MNRIGNYISAFIRCIVYKTIIAPHFQYCATLLIDMRKTLLSKLQKAQNRAMRIILQSDRHTKVEGMPQALQFISIKQRLYYNVCIFIFKILKNMLKSMFYEGVTLYNTLPAEIKRYERIVPFKRKLKAYIVINVN